jgi:hypothetical protein
MRVIAHGLLEATFISQQRSVAIAAIEAAIKFMRSMGENDAHMPCDGDSDAEKSTLSTGEVCASVVAHMNSQQLLLLFEELLVMLAREPRVGWQRAVLATAHTLCGHIKCEDDAVRVLLLLLYPPQSIDSFVLVDAVFVQLLSVCPQAHSPILSYLPHHQYRLSPSYFSTATIAVAIKAPSPVTLTRDAGVQSAPCHPHGGARRERNGHSQPAARRCCCATQPCAFSC